MCTRKHSSCEQNMDPSQFAPGIAQKLWSSPPPAPSELSLPDISTFTETRGRDCISPFWSVCLHNRALHWMLFESAVMYHLQTLLVITKLLVSALKTINTILRDSQNHLCIRAKPFSPTDREWFQFGSRDPNRGPLEKHLFPHSWFLSVLASPSLYLHSRNFRLSWSKKPFVNLNPSLSLSSGILYQVSQRTVIVHVEGIYWMHIFEKVNKRKIEDWCDEEGHVSVTIDPSRSTSNFSSLGII